MEHGNFRGFQSANNKVVPINPDALIAVKRKFSEIEEESSSSKRSASSSSAHANGLAASDDKALTDNLEKDKHGKVFSSFTTASNKKVAVSETALLEAKKKLAEADDIMQSGTVSTGFSTASNKNIPVSETALAQAKRKLNEAVEELENCKSLPQSPVSRNMGVKPRGFISPIVSTINRMQMHSPISPSPLTNYNSPVNSMSGRVPNKGTFRTPYKMQPGPSKSDDSTATVLKRDSMDSKASTSWSDEEDTVDANNKNITSSSNINMPKTPMSTNRCHKKVDIVSLHSYLKQHVELLAIVSKSQKFVPVKSCDPSVKKACLELSDGTGSVVCDFFLRNPPTTVEVGSVILIQQAFVKENAGKLSLLVSCKSTVYFHVCSQEADSLRLAYRRLAPQPRSSNCTFPTTKNSDNRFEYGALTVIAKLDGKDNAFVKGYVHEIKLDSNIIYLGCSQCKVKLIADRTCRRCDSAESRYYYVLQISIFDFSGSVRATIFDPTATKLVGENADEAAKLIKYQPDKLRQKITPLEFSLPLIFKIVRNNGKWTVEDFTSVDFSTCSTFLRETVTAKKLLT